MAYAVRIDDIIEQAGKLFIYYTEGQTPLPASTKTQVIVTEKEAWNREISIQAPLIERRVLINLAMQMWRRYSGTLDPTALIGKTVTYSPESPMGRIVVIS